MGLKKSEEKIGSYRYAAGRIRSMEMKLMDNGRLNRLFEARSISEILPLLQESGYPSGDPEDAIAEEERAVYGLIAEMMPESGYVDTLLLFHDGHNLKTMLKYLAAWLAKTGEQNGTGIPYSEEKPDSRLNGRAYVAADSDSHGDMKAIESLMMSPSLVAPEVLFGAIRDRRPGEVPNWLYQLAQTAVKKYLETYDISSIDLVIDRAVHEKAKEYAEQLGNEWFIGYLKLVRDIVNLEILLRCKALNVGYEYFRQCLLPAGDVKESTWIRFFEDNSGQWIDELRKSTLSDFSEIAVRYGSPGTAAQFGRLADSIILEYLRKAQRILSGPEVPLAYLLARLTEIKNIRIAITCLRNGISSARAKEMARGTYLNWGS